jgi:hypothetical protein
MRERKNMDAKTMVNLFGERAVQLCDGREGLRSGLTVTAKAESGKPIINFVASDDTCDRYNEVIEASGWELETYRKNPVFQNAHQYGDILFTLGKALVTEVRDGKLFQSVEFAVDVNPMAKIAYGLYAGGFLNAVSVGFVPKKWVDGKKGSDGSDVKRRYTRQELLETSGVGIPANPNALALGLKAGAIEKADLKAVYEMISRTVNQSEAAGRGDKSTLLRLAREWTWRETLEAL